MPHRHKPKLPETKLIEEWFVIPTNGGNCCLVGRVASSLIQTTAITAISHGSIVTVKSVYKLGKRRPGSFWVKELAKYRQEVFKSLVTMALVEEEEIR